MKNLLVQLHDFDLITVNGIDSAKFLQGQLTCNLEHVSNTQSVAGAYCNIKGRVITDFRLFKRVDTYYLQTEPGLGAALKQTLDRYIVFSKAKTADNTDSIRRFGVLGDDASRRLQTLLPELAIKPGACTQTDEVAVICLPGPESRFEIYEFTPDSATMNTLIANYPDYTAEQETGLREWLLADIRDGTAHITNALQEEYTPQLLNYDINGLVDFKKGCYTGQEIVARMHYRSSAKKRLYHIRAAGPADEILALTYTHNGVTTTADIISRIRTDAGIFELLAILPCEIAADSIGLQLVTGSAQATELKAAVVAAGNR